MAMMTATTAAMMELMDMVPPFGLSVTPGLVYHGRRRESRRILGRSRG